MLHRQATQARQMLRKLIDGRDHLHAGRRCCDGGSMRCTLGRLIHQRGVSKSGRGPNGIRTRV